MNLNCTNIKVILLLVSRMIQLLLSVFNVEAHYFDLLLAKAFKFALRKDR